MYSPLDEMIGKIMNGEHSSIAQEFGRLEPDGALMPSLVCLLSQKRYVDDLEIRTYDVLGLPTMERRNGSYTLHGLLQAVITFQRDSFFGNTKRKIYVNEIFEYLNYAAILDPRAELFCLEPLDMPVKGLD